MKNILVIAVATASMILATPGVPAARELCDVNGACQSDGARHNWRGHHGHGYGRGYGGGYRGGYGGGYRGGYDGGDGYDAGGGVAALAAGAIIGGVLATQYQSGYGGPQSYCARRYRSYDPGSGTYLGYDGFRHRCG